MKVSVKQTLLIVILISFCWLTIQATHEFGHITVVWLSGGSIDRVILHPMTFSRTDVKENPPPVFEVWSGAFGGCLFPLLFWGSCILLHLPDAFYSVFGQAFV